MLNKISLLITSIKVHGGTKSCHMLKPLTT